MILFLIFRIIFRIVRIYFQLWLEWRGKDVVTCHSMFASTNIWSKHTYLNSFKQSIFKPKKVTVCFRSWCVVLYCKFNRKSQHHPDLNKQTYHQGKYSNIYLHYHKMDCSLLLKRINIMYILVYTVLLWVPFSCELFQRFHSFVFNWL